MIRVPKTSEAGLAGTRFDRSDGTAGTRTGESANTGARLR